MGVQELENAANMMAKLKVQLESQLNEAKHVADNEAKERAALLGKFKNLEHELDGVKDHLDEETGIKSDLLRQVNKANQESDMWRSKYETEGVAKAEDIEMNKLKLQARLTEAQGTIEQLQLKAAQVEKAKQFDKLVCEWKLKAESTSMDLDTAQKECRNASSELFRIKSAYEESVLQLDEVRKENKVLSNEIKDIMDQISEGGRSIHEIDKIRKRLEAEKMELQAALEEAEGALEQEENKVLRSQLELSQVRQEIERRIAEKDEEFQSTRKNFTKAVDGMQTALEQESKGKAEALRMKRSLKLMFLNWKLLLSTPTLLMVKHKRPSRSTMAPSGMPKPSLRMNREPRKLPGMDFWVMNARPTPPRTLLKRPALCLSNLTALAASLNKSSQTPMSNFQNSLAKTKLLLEPRGSSSLRCKHCMVIWTRCPVRLLSLRRRPRRQWLMLPALLRNSVLNKTWLLDSRGNANSLNAKSRTAPPGWTMPRPMPSREARRP